MKREFVGTSSVEAGIILIGDSSDPVFGVHSMGFRSRIGKMTSDIGDNMRKIFVNMIALISTIFLMLGSVGHAQDLPPGYITTIAGDTTNGYNGDYRSSAGALLSLPRGIALTNAEDAILFADSENHRIRNVDLKSGNIYTIAGNGSSDFRGDGKLIHLLGGIKKQLHHLAVRGWMV